MKHLRPTSRAALVACAAAAACAAAPTAASAATGTMTLKLSTASGAGKSLKAAGAKVQAVKPATLRAGTLTLPTTSVTLGVSPVVRHAGALRFVKGKRKVTFTQLRTTLGTAPAVTGVVGKKRLTLFTLKGGTLPQADAATGSVTTTGTTVTLASGAARTIKSGLKLRRLAAGSLGRASVTGTDPSAISAPKQAAPGAPVPGPIVQPPAGGVAPTAPGTPTTPTQPTPPTQPQPQPPVVPDPPDPVTPELGDTRWVSSTIAYDGSHRSFIRYILNPFWDMTCPAGVTPFKEVAPSGGITRAPDPADPVYDFLVDQTVATATTLQHRGRLRYTMACHGIDQWVENLRFTDLDKVTGRVLADGSYGNRDNPDAPDVAYTGEHLLNLDLANATKTTNADGSKTFTDVKSTVAAGAQEELGDNYPEGTEWGLFTFTLPKP